ncbi:hypothetical protein OB955_17595 [Halobacteria archaeon AArc-m2/3/4]|uniref:AMP-binding enzyme n=1 Tax=Natronoglomus mannanivorans TaxID=2979990 RepID=A0AAP2YYA0_9EURY|nr:hypothetical protein [Halobacteria archaeon AArc-xg1-1]MCU4974537.1 hypothetical protein [Halobacteria archaeon AArc-m2/3/4]
MNASTVGDLFERERRSEEPALEDATGRVYDYHWLCTSSWKAGNFLRHSGVRRGVTVGVVGDGPLALLAFFGTALLEGTTRFEPPEDLEDEYSANPGSNARPENGTERGTAEFRTLVAPVDALERYTLPQGAQRVGYGRKPDDPAVHHFDAGLWSENPSFPTLEIDPETPLLSDGEGRYTHRTVLETAQRIVDEWGIDDETRVRVNAELADPRAVTAGVIAPLAAGGTVVLADSDSGRVDSDADVVVAHGDSDATLDRGRIDCSSLELPRS